MWPAALPLINTEDHHVPAFRHGQSRGVRRTFTEGVYGLKEGLPLANLLPPASPLLLRNKPAVATWSTTVSAATFLARIDQVLTVP